MTSLNSRDIKLPEIPVSWLVGTTLIILALAGFFALMLLRTELLLILLAGLFLGIAIKPSVNRLTRKGIPKEVAASLILISILVLLAILIGLGLPLLTEQTLDIANVFSQAYRDLRVGMGKARNVLIKQLVQTMPVNLFEFGEAQAQPEDGGNSAELAEFGNLTGQIVRAGLGILFVAFLAINWAVEGDRFILTAVLLSNQPREYLRVTYARVEEKLSRYLSGLGKLSLIIGAASFIGYLLIGLPYAFLLGIFAGIMEAVPVIGPTLGAIPAAIVALSISPGAVIAVILVTILIQAVENAWLVSWVMGKSTGVPPFVTLIVLIAFSTLFGIAGALLAIPIAAVVQALYESIIEQRRKLQGEEIGRDQFSAMRYKLRGLIEDIPLKKVPKDEAIKGQVEDIEDQLETIALDLDSLLQRPGGEDTR